MRIARGGWWFILGAPLLPLAAAVALHLCGGICPVSTTLYIVAAVLFGFMLFFFRDPERSVPDDESLVVAGADGLVRAVTEMYEGKFLNVDTVRISIFLSPFNVHVNRSPIGGKVESLQYTPGKHLLTISNASSEHNEHSSILIRGQGTRCLVKQIVGPIVRRVVYWLELGQDIAKGDRIGMMKFGSRLDMYFPRDEVEVCVQKGDRVTAGETILARIKKDLS
ncbi:MAG: phosphatidylserine decarboxylase family protein [Verrucomicrobia bacterium]|nr:phosphatidylserine decarboxylase family protein [Verrucomicrobiota bacterium]